MSPSLFFLLSLSLLSAQLVRVCVYTPMFFAPQQKKKKKRKGFASEEGKRVKERNFVKTFPSLLSLSFLSARFLFFFYLCVGETGHHTTYTSRKQLPSFLFRPDSTPRLVQKITAYRQNHLHSNFSRPDGQEYADECRIVDRSEYSTLRTDQITVRTMYKTKTPREIRWISFDTFHALMDDVFRNNASKVEVAYQFRRVFRIVQSGRFGFQMSSRPSS